MTDKIVLGPESQQTACTQPQTTDIDGKTIADVNLSVSLTFMTPKTLISSENLWTARTRPFSLLAFWRLDTDPELCKLTLLISIKGFTVSLYTLKSHALKPCFLYYCPPQTTRNNGKIEVNGFNIISWGKVAISMQTKPCPIVLNKCSPTVGGKPR